MFYYPNRTQAMRIQETLKTVYAGVKGEYYFGDGAWDFIKKETSVDLLKILKDIAEEKIKE
jgi:type II restriction enzyme